MQSRLWTAILLFLLPGIAQAQPLTPQQVNKALSSFFETATLDTSSGCSATLKMDEDALQSSIRTDVLKKKREIKISFFAQQNAKSLIFLTYYGNRPIDLCHFEIYMKMADQNDHKSDALLFSFDFTKALYSKIDWSQPLAVDLPEIAPNYNETIQYRAYVAVDNGEKLLW